MNIHKRIKLCNFKLVHSSENAANLFEFFLFFNYLLVPFSCIFLLLPVIRVFFLNIRAPSTSLHLATRYARYAIWWTVSFTQQQCHQNENLKNGGSLNGSSKWYHLLSPIRKHPLWIQCPGILKILLTCYKWKI